MSLCWAIMSGKWPLRHFTTEFIGAGTLVVATPTAPQLRTIIQHCIVLHKKISNTAHLYFFFQVFKALSKDDRRWYAVKISVKRFESSGDRRRKLREVQKHELLPKHPNLISFVRAWEEFGFLYIQTELCQCRLMQILFFLLFEKQVFLLVASRSRIFSAFWITSWKWEISASLNCGVSSRIYYWYLILLWLKNVLYFLGCLF